MRGSPKPLQVLASHLTLVFLGLFSIYSGGRPYIGEPWMVYTVALAMAGSRHRADLQLHQAVGRKAYHLAQNIRVRGLLHQGAQVHHVVGHWLVPRLR